MPYSYNDFLNAATSSGLLGEFSQADLETAQRYPEFGLSILSLKRDYHDAATDRAETAGQRGGKPTAQQLRELSGRGRRGQLLLPGEDPRPDRRHPGPDQQLRLLHL